MRRLLKLLFTRMPVVLFLIFLQVIVYIVLWKYLNDAYIYIHSFFSVISILTLLFVINKQEPASYKLPWIFILLVLPLYGVIIFSLFGNRRLSKKSIKKFEEIYQQSNMVISSNNESVIQNIKDKDALVASQSLYINTTSKLPVYENSKTKYFKMGEEFYESLIEKLKGAEKYIFLEYFIIERGKMWDTILEILKEKIATGVEVYLIYDDIGCISKLPHNYKKTLEALGIKCSVFNPFIPIASAIHNNRDHRKIAVIDGLYAYTGGINLADEYINENKYLGKWKDSAILVEGEAVASFIVMFIQNYNSFSKEKVEYDKYLKDVRSCENGKGFVQPFGDGPRPFYSDRVGENVYLNIINNAKNYVYITTPYLIVDYHFILALKNACKRGVDVRIMTPHIPDKKIIYFMTKSNYRDLIDAGVKIIEYEPGFIHAKNFVCDDQIGVVGTINLDYRSFVHHFECGTWMHNSDVILDIKNDFIDTCNNEGIYITKEKAKLKSYQILLKNLLEIFSPLL